MIVEVVTANLEHAWRVAADMRVADREEVKAASGLDPLVALELSLEVSTQAWAGLVDGETVCMFGVGAPSLIADAASPWLLSTDKLVTYQRPFLRRCRRYVGQMLAFHPRLINAVDARNACSIRWLRWLGFEIHDPMPFGVSGLPFHLFTMERG